MLKLFSFCKIKHIVLSPKQTTNFRFGLACLCFLINFEAFSQSSFQDNRPKELEFYSQVMNAPPIMPANQSTQEIGCLLRPANDLYKTSSEVNYQTYGWEARISHDPEFIDTKLGKVLIIDFAQKNKEIAYRYLSNNNTHNSLYEPWSSSKIFAFTGAIAKMRQLGLGAQAKIGDTYIADIITSINTYKDFGSAPDNSNALASFLANVAGREYLSALFYDKWLKLSRPGIKFRGAYGPDSFAPANYNWQMLDSKKSTTISPYLNASKDPAYLSYRCDTCGLIGNKPMTTLAQAEWLKRLAVHARDPSTKHPFITQDDIKTLFYGNGHSYGDNRFAGMSLGISNMLQGALSKAIDDKSVSPKLTLDKATGGNFRVFQKIGWGPSETRSRTENVVLAHVCLPDFQGGREFSIAAQVSVAEAKEENLQQAGKNMEALLELALKILLSE